MACVITYLVAFPAHRALPSSSELHRRGPTTLDRPVDFSTTNRRIQICDGNFQYTKTDVTQHSVRIEVRFETKKGETNEQE